MAALPRYRSGWCNDGEHRSCRGTYAGTQCHCRCHDFDE